MGDIVNLRAARKAKARRGHERNAAQNRVAFGQTKQQRGLAERQRAMAERKIDAHLREPSDDSGE